MPLFPFLISWCSTRTISKFIYTFLLTLSLYVVIKEIRHNIQSKQITIISMWIDSHGIRTSFATPMFSTCQWIITSLSAPSRYSHYNLINFYLYISRKHLSFKYKCHYHYRKNGKNRTRLFVPISKHLHKRRLSYKLIKLLHWKTSVYPYN